MDRTIDHAVEGSTHRFDLTRLAARLQTRTFGRDVRYRDSTASTNADALACAQQSSTTQLPHGAIFLTDCQTSGRGRRGRTWHSPAEGNLYCSVVLRPPTHIVRTGPWLSWIPLLTALAAADSLSAFIERPVVVKWPNDLLIGEQKVGGILCEQTAGPDMAPTIVVGIGVNVNGSLDHFPADLLSQATSLAAERGRTLDRVEILADFLVRLEQRITRLWQEGSADLVEEFTPRCSTVGALVRITVDGQGLLEGIAESIGPDGCLRLRRLTPDGRSADLQDIHSAEVVHLRR